MHARWTPPLARTTLSSSAVRRSWLSVTTGPNGSRASAVAVVASALDGAVRYLDWGFISDRPEQLVEQTAAKLLREPEWARLERTVSPLVKKEVSLGTLMGDWLRFQATLPLASAGFVGGHARKAVERGVTNTFVGADAGEIGRVSPMLPHEAARLADARINELAGALEPERLEEDAATWGQSTPRAWRHLRRLALGLVDGSDLPDEFVRQRRANLDEVLPPSFITPPPGPERLLGRTLRGVDVEALAALAAESDEASQAPKVDAPGVSEASEDSIEPETSDQRKKTRGGASGKKKVDTATAPASSREEQLSEWVEVRRRSLMWRMASHVYHARRDEQASVRAARDAIANNQTAPDTSALERARKRLIASWIATFAGLALVVVVTGWAKESWWIDHWIAEDWKSVLVWTILLTLVFVLGGHQYYRALRKYEWQVRVRLHRLRTASDEYVVARQQEKRWALMYAGLLDWSDLLSEVLHRPWTQRDLPMADIEGSPPGLPAAVSLGVPAGASVEPSGRRGRRGGGSRVPPRLADGQFRPCGLAQLCQRPREKRTERRPPRGPGPRSSREWSPRGSDGHPG